MKRHWKKIAIAIGALVLLVVGGSFIYAKVINKADPEFGQSDVNAKLDAATTTIASSSTATVDPSTTLAPVASAPAVTTPQSSTGAANTGLTSIDGTWNIKEGSEVGYRVKESINGFDTTANGRSQSITGSMVAAGTTITQGQFTVDMATFRSDEGGRDEQFKDRVMNVAKYPTSTFVLTAPIDFGAVPPDGGKVNATATGALTLHGTTKSVTFDVQGTFKNGLIGVLGQIPVVFADWEIPAPSIGSIRTEDNGLLEFVLVLQHA
jgi:polyisoprenoid-binding protein YceI